MSGAEQAVEIADAVALSIDRQRRARLYAPALVIQAAHLHVEVRFAGERAVLINKIQSGQGGFACGRDKAGAVIDLAASNGERPPAENAALAAAVAVAQRAIGQRKGHSLPGLQQSAIIVQRGAAQGE